MRAKDSAANVSEWSRELEASTLPAGGEQSPPVVRFVRQPPSAVAIGEPFTVAVAVYEVGGSPAASGRVELALVEPENSVTGSRISPASSPVQSGLALFSGVTIGDGPGGEGFKIRAAYYLDPQLLAEGDSASFRIGGRTISQLLATCDSGKAQGALWKGELPGCDAGTGEGLGSLPPGEFARVWVSVNVTSGNWSLFVEGGPLDGEVRLSGTGPGGQLPEVTAAGKNLPFELIELGPGNYNLVLVLASQDGTYGLGGDLYLVLRGDGQAGFSGDGIPFLREVPAEVEVGQPFRLVLCVPAAGGAAQRVTFAGYSAAYEAAVQESVAVFEGVTVPFSVPDSASRAQGPGSLSVHCGDRTVGSVRVKPHQAFRLIGHEGRQDVWNSSLGVGGAGVPVPGEGTLINQGRFAVFDWTFTALSGSKLVLAGDGAGTVAFTVYHGWQLELSRQLAGGNTQIYTLTSEVYGRAGDNNWLVELNFGDGGFVPGTYGARLSLTADGPGCGASEVYLVGKGLSLTDRWHNFPRPVVRAVDFPPLELDVPPVVEAPVGGEYRIWVNLKTTAFKFSNFTFRYSLDLRAVEVVRVEPPGTSPNRLFWWGSQIYVCADPSTGSQFTSGSPPFDLVVKVKQPGDWGLELLGNSGSAGPDSNVLEWYKSVRAAITLRGESPPPGAARASPVVVDPVTGEALLTVTEENLGGAARVVLTDSNGSTIELPVSPAGGTLVTARGALPAGLYIWSGEKLENLGWLAYVAVPVPAGETARVEWSLRLPPENVRFGGYYPNAPVELGDFIKRDASVVGAFDCAVWDELKSKTDEEVVEAAENLRGVTEPLSPLFDLSDGDMEKYFRQLSQVYPDLARRLYSEKELGLWSILQAAQEGSEES